MGGKFLNEIVIGRRERKLPEFIGPHPAEILALDRLQFTAQETAKIEMQLNSPFGIRVRNDFPRFFNFNQAAKFLSDFPFQAGLETFTVFPLAPREFPQASQMIAFFTLGDKDFSVVPDNRGAYLDGKGARHIQFIMARILAMACRAKP